MKKFALFLMMFTVSAAVLFVGINDFRGAIASSSWPSAPGVIDSSEAHLTEGCIRFSYNVAGQAHTATTVFFHEESVKTNGQSPSCHDDVVARYPAGKNVIVRYNPQDPAYAVLEPGPNTTTFVLLAVGGAFTLLGGWLLWKEIAARFRVRSIASLTRASSLPGNSAGTPALADIAASGLGTPSEVVAIYGDRFAARMLGGNIFLLDGATEVSARELVLAELKAAILALEEAGTIHLEVSGTSKRELCFVPGAARYAWPNPSTESRLEFPAREEATVVVKRWLAQHSHVGWERAAEKTYVPLVLRRAAVVSQRGPKRRYILVNRDVEAMAARSFPAVAGLLQQCESERPEVWNLLATAIEAAVEANALQSADAASVYPATDPWYDEAAVDTKSTPGLRLLGELSTPWWQVTIWSAVLWSLVAATAYYSPTHGRIAIGAGVALTALLFAAARRWVNVASQTYSRLPWVRPMVEATLQGDWRKSAVIVLPLGALTAVLIDSNKGDPRAIGGAAACVLIGGMWLLKRKAGQAITGHVIGVPNTTSAPAASLAARGSAQAAVGAVATLAPPPAALPFEIEIVKPSDLPPLSANSRSRIDAIRKRGPRLRRIYAWSSFILAAGSTAVALLAWRMLDGASFPWFTAGAFVVTLLALSGARSENSVITPLFLISRYTLRYLRGGEAQQRNRWQKEITPIRPVVPPLLGFAWALFTLLRSLTYLGGPAPAKWVPAVLSAAVVSAYAFDLRRRRRALESEYPVYPPLSLMALRVFGSPSRDRFVELLDLWHWFGPLYRLDGPDTAGGKSSDVFAYVTGRLDKAITEDEAELEQAGRHFSQTRDSQLRFSFNSLQCNDRIWKAALRDMLDRADIIVMDLSGLTERNRGCAYEIGTLVNEVPLERFLLLINDETDLEFLRRLLSQVTAGQDAGAGRRRLRLFHLGTQPVRKDNESVYDWQRRTTNPIDADRLIGLLCDAACTKRSAQSPLMIPWTRPGYRRAPIP